MIAKLHSGLVQQLTLGGFLLDERWSRGVTENLPLPAEEEDATRE